MSAKTTTVASSSPVSSSNWKWIAAALIAHMGWGAYPVLGRYLQTISQLPSMTLLAFGNLLPLVFLLVIFRHKINLSMFRSRTLWLLAAVVVVRAFTNMLASRYTLSIYVQLITQSTPFLVVLFGATLFKERIPRYTGTAITICLMGALLMMSGNIGQVNTSAGVSRVDWLGLSLAMGSSLSLALYMLIVRRTSESSHEVSGEAVMIMQMASIALFATITSLLVGENWHRWLEVGPMDWLAFGALSISVFLVGNLGQIAGIRHLGAPMVSSLMASRLVSALVLGAIILGERLDSWWQLLGAILVLVTITWYLSQQSK